MIFAGKLMLRAGALWLGVDAGGKLALVDASVGSRRVFVAYDLGGGLLGLQNALATWVFLNASQAENGWYPVLYSVQSGANPTPLQARHFDYARGQARLVFPREDNGELVGLLTSNGINPRCQCQFDVGTSAIYATDFMLERLTPGVAEIGSSKDGRGCDFGPVGATRVQLSALRFEGVNFSDAIFDEADLSRSAFPGCTFHSASLRGATLTNTSFDGAFLEGAVFDGCDLTQGTTLPAPPLAETAAQRVGFRDAVLDMAALHHDWSCLDLTGAMLKGIDAQSVAGLVARDTLFPAVSFEGLPLDGADFARSRVRDCTFIGASLKGACFGSADLDGAVFADCDLTGAHFDPQPADGSSTLLTNAILSNTILTEADMRRADLRGAVLTGATLIHTDLREALLGAPQEDDAARLSYAYFEETRFDGADLSNASFAYATFQTAAGTIWLGAAKTLAGCDFGNAYLRGVDFAGGDLRGARFTGACLVGASFVGADLSPEGDRHSALVGAALQGARFASAKLAGADLTNAAVVFVQGAFPVRYCDAEQRLAPPPPGTFKLLYDPTTDLDTNTLADTTICPNGHSFAVNKRLGVSLPVMLSSPNAPTMWLASQCGP